MATLIGTPTAGALVPTFSQAHFDHLIVFTGVLCITGGAALGVAHVMTLHQEKRARPSGEKERHDGQIEEGGDTTTSTISDKSATN